MATLASRAVRAPRPVGISGRRTFDNVAKLGITLVTLAAGIVALIIADGSLRDVHHSLAVQITLGFAFLFALGTIVVVSLSTRTALSIQILMLYFAIYLILPGYNHATRGVFPFFSISYPTWMVQNAALAVLLFLMSTVAAYGFMALRGGAQKERPRPVTRLEPNTYMSVILTILAFFGAVIYVRSVGIGSVFSGREVTFMVEIDAQTSGIIIALPRVLCIISLVYSLMIARYSLRKALGIGILAVNLIPSIFVLWPIGLPRSTLFGLILFVSMVVGKFDRPDRRLLLSMLYLFGALVAMPLMDALTRGGYTVDQLSANLILSQYFQSGDFDGLQSINNIVLYVDRNGYSYGHQLLSALLFFVPRALWTGKGEPTGSVAAEAAGYNFLNVSMPLPGELFMDFGWLGIVFGGMLLGYILQRIDHFIDTNWFNSQKGRLVAGVMVGYTIVIYRGTLIGVVAPFAVLCVLAYLTSRFGLRPARIQSRR